MLDFSDVLAEGARSCCGRWTSSRRAASASNRAITTSSSTSSRTPAGRSGSWCRCSSRRGAKASGSPTNPSIFVVGDRKQSIYRFRDADVAVLEQAAEYIEGLRPDGRPRRSIARSFRAVPDLLHFVNDVFTEMSQPDAGSGELHLRRARSLSGRATSPAPTPRARTDRSASRSRTRRTSAPPPSPTKSRRSSTVGDRPRQGDRHRRGRPGPATSASCSGRGRAIASSSASSNARGIPTYVYKGLGLLRRRRNQGRRRADSLSRRADVAPARGGVPALALHPAVGSRRWRGWRPTLASALTPTRCRPRWTRCWTTRIGDVLEHWRGPAVARWLALVDRITPAELLDAISRRDRLRLRARRTAPAAGLGEPQEDARPRPPHPEPRLRHAAAHRRLPDVAERAATNPTPSSRRSTRST